MERVLILLVAIVAGIGVLVLGGLLANRINLFVRRYVPGFWYDGETFLLWGILFWTMFAMGAYLLHLFTH